LKIRHLLLVIAYTPRRVVCPACGVRVEQVPWADRWSRVTKSLARAVAELARRTDLSTVANQYALHWKTVAGIIRRVVAWGLRRRRQRPLRVLGIDEVSRKKGHKYLTLVYDLERGELVWIGKDRTTATLNRFFDELGRRRSRNLKAVCMDMWAPYLDVVRDRAPEAFCAAQEPVEFDPEAEGFAQLPGAQQSSPVTGMVPQGGLPALLGLCAGRMGAASSGPVALVGKPLTVGTVQGFRADDSQAQGGDPGLDEATDQQRRLGRHEQQGKVGQPSELRLSQR
jgi:hypothetical protein